MSYKGQRKSNYNPKRRPRFSTRSHSRRNKAFKQQGPTNLPAPAGLYSAQPLADSASGLGSVQASELWLKIPRDFTFNGFEGKLPNDPTILNRQAQELVRIASNCNCEIQLRTPRSNEPIRRFRILMLDSEQPITMADVTPMDSQFVALKLELETLGWTLLSVPDES